MTATILNEYRLTYKDVTFGIKSYKNQLRSYAEVTRYDGSLVRVDVILPLNSVEPKFVVNFIFGLLNQRLSTEHKIWLHCKEYLPPLESLYERANRTHK